MRITKTEQTVRMRMLIWVFVGRTCQKVRFLNIRLKFCFHFNPSLAKHGMPVLANSVDPDQLASEEANWSGSALFDIIHVNFYQKPGSSNLIGWKLEVGVAS